MPRLYGKKWIAQLREGVRLGEMGHSKKRTRRRPSQRRDTSAQSLKPLRAPAPLGQSPKSWLTWVAAISIFFLTALVVLYPALSRGSSLGPFDLLSAGWLSHQNGVIVHNVVSSDQIQQMIPWMDLAWKEVHSGHLPLWNPYTLLGLPLAFNWQSAAFSAPSLVGYLFPVSDAYAVSVVVRLVIAASGMFYASRKLELVSIAGIFAGLTFEFCGPFAVWAGYPITDVFAWFGWATGALLALVAGSVRRTDMAVLAIALAGAVYGGNPESFAFFVVALAVVGSAAFIALLCHREAQGGSVVRVRAIGKTALAVFSGLALASPLLLPGAQVALASVRTGPSGFGALPLRDVVIGWLFSGYDGTPVAGSTYFGSPPATYYVTAAYVGPIVVCLAIVGVACYVRRAAVVALVAGLLVFCGAIYVGFVASMLQHLALVSALIWSRGLGIVGGLVALLAAHGADAILRRHPRARISSTIAFVLMCALLAAIGIHFVVSDKALSLTDIATRSRSFIWPAAGAGTGLVGVAAWWLCHDEVLSSKVITSWLMILISVEAGFLVTSEQPLWSWSSSFFKMTSAEQRVQRLVGPALIGVGSCVSGVGSFSNLGLLPNTNVVFGVDELEGYDSMMPKGYYELWARLTGVASYGEVGVFCPAIASIKIARTFGIGYILEPEGTRGPTGTRLVGTVGAESVYRVPGSGRFELVDGDRVEWAVSGRYGDGGTWTAHVASARRATLIIHVTAEPGWRATLDGAPLALKRYQHVMLEAIVPRGSYVVRLYYAPPLFCLGLWLASGCLLLWVAALFAGSRLRSVALGAWPRVAKSLSRTLKREEHPGP